MTPSSKQIREAIQDAEIAKADITSLAAVVDELEHRIATGDLDAVERLQIASWVLPRAHALVDYFEGLAAGDAAPAVTNYRLLADATAAA